MKYIYYFLVILTILSSQNLKTSTDEKTGDPMLVGIAQRSDITVEHYGKWFDEEYSEYRGDEELITASKDFLGEIEIKILFDEFKSSNKLVSNLSSLKK